MVRAVILQTKNVLVQTYSIIMDSSKSCYFNAKVYCSGRLIKFFNNKRDFLKHFFLKEQDFGKAALIVCNISKKDLNHITCRRICKILIAAVF